MQTGTTTIKVYTDNKNELTSRFGKPTHEAFQKLLKAQCTHPRECQAFTIGLIPAGDADAIREHGNIQVAGFYCSDCNSYIFPAQIENPRRDGQS